MDQSVASRASNASSVMLEELAHRSVTAKYHLFSILEYSDLRELSMINK